MHIPIVITSYTLEESEDDYETLMEHCHSLTEDTSSTPSTLRSENNVCTYIEWIHESRRNSIYALAEANDCVSANMDNNSVMAEPKVYKDYRGYYSADDIRNLQLTTKRLVNNEYVEYLPNAYYHCIYIRPVL